jgi:GT2 family glycosyltransferase
MVAARHAGIRLRAQLVAQWAIARDRKMHAGQSAHRLDALPHHFAFDQGAHHQYDRHASRKPERGRRRGARAEAVEVDSVGDQGATISGGVGGEIVGVDADKSVAAEQAKLAAVRSRWPVPILSYEDMRWPLAVMLSRAQHPIQEWVGAGERNVIVLRPIRPEETRDERSFFPGGLAAQKRDLREALETLPWNQGSAEVAVRSIRPFATGTDERNLIPVSSQLSSDGHERDLRSPCNAVQAWEREQNPHLNCSELPVHNRAMQHMPPQEVKVSTTQASEGQRLLSCLATAKAQCGNVVYADSGSTDGSVEAAREMDLTVVVLDSDAVLTAAAGRRAGADRLLQVFPDCRYVQFIDGDCILQPDWLATGCSFLDKHPRAAVVCGRRFEAFPQASFYNELIDDEWNTPIGPAAASGGDALMRVQALRAAGSFRADLLAGEEPELCSRLRTLGWEIWRIDAAMTEHDAKISNLGQWLRRAQRAGFGYAQVWAATRKSDFPLYGRQIVSTLFWILVIPLTVAFAAAVGHNWRILFLLPAAYGVQIIRMAARGHRHLTLIHRLRAASVMMISKAAEARGLLRYFLGRGHVQATTYRGPQGNLSGGRA